jgi:hypothetical protein
MASFCKQCSEYLWKEDFRDLADLVDEIGEYGGVLCEGCGPTWVNKDGLCSGKCLRKHGNLPIEDVKKDFFGEAPF